jgi:hypothetical protein
MSYTDEGAISLRDDARYDDYQSSLGDGPNETPVDESNPNDIAIPGFAWQPYYSPSHEGNKDGITLCRVFVIGKDPNMPLSVLYIAKFRAEYLESECACNLYNTQKGAEDGLLATTKADIKYAASRLAEIEQNPSRFTAAAKPNVMEAMRRLALREERHATMNRLVVDEITIPAKALIHAMSKYLQANPEA